MAAFFVLQLLFVILLLVDIGEWVGVSYFPDLVQHLAGQWMQYLAYAIWLPVIAMVALWFALIILAFAGSTWPVPILNRLTHRSWIMRLSFFINSIVLLLIPIVAGFAFHANSLTRSTYAGAAVYFLYDEGISVPRWGYALGLYRVSLQARRNWGMGSVVLDRLNRETLRMALTSGKVVILATHGGDGVACTYYAPEQLGVSAPESGIADPQGNFHFLRTSVLGEDGKWGKVENVTVNNELRLMYVFGCDVGKKATQWEEHLSPAKVITYNRASTVFDHGYWFAFAGPTLLKNLQ